MGDDPVTVETADGVTVITLNRPDRLNAFTGAMGAGLGRAYAACDADDSVRAAVVMMRIATLVVEFELLPSDTDMDTNNIVTRLLAAKLGLPAPGPEPLPAV